MERELVWIKVLAGGGALWGAPLMKITGWRGKGGRSVGQSVGVGADGCMLRHFGAQAAPASLRPPPYPSATHQILTVAAPTRVQRAQAACTAGCAGAPGAFGGRRMLGRAVHAGMHAGAMRRHACGRRMPACIAWGAAQKEARAGGGSRRPPTQKVTMHAPTPRLRAKPSAA